MKYNIYWTRICVLTLCMVTVFAMMDTEEITDDMNSMNLQEEESKLYLGIDQFKTEIYRIIFSFLDSKDQCAYSSINSNLSKVRVFYLCMRVKNLLFNVNTTITHLSGTLLFSFEEYYRILMNEIDADELNYFFPSQKISEWMKYNGIRSGATYQSYDYNKINGKFHWHDIDRNEDGEFPYTLSHFPLAIKFTVDDTHHMEFFGRYHIKPINFNKKDAHFYFLEILKTLNSQKTTCNHLTCGFNVNSSSNTMTNVRSVNWRYVSSTGKHSAVFTITDNYKPKDKNMIIDELFCTNSNSSHNIEKLTAVFSSSNK